MGAETRSGWLNGRLLIWVLASIAGISVYGVIQGVNHQIRFGHLGMNSRLEKLEKAVSKNNDLLIRISTLLEPETTP